MAPAVHARPTSFYRLGACRSPPSPRPPTSTARAGLFPASRLPNLACAGNRHAMFTILLFREGVTTVHGKPANFPLFFVMFCSWEAAVLFCIFCGSSFMENHRLFLIIFRGLFSFIGKSRRLLLSCFALLYVFVLRAFFFCFSYTCSTFRLFSFLFFSRPHSRIRTTGASSGRTQISGAPSDAGTPRSQARPAESRQRRCVHHGQPHLSSDPSPA